MPSDASGSRFPRLVGIFCLALGFYDLAACALIPPDRSTAVVLGFALKGVAGWIATGVTGLFFLWLGYACLQRKGIAAWVVIAYCVYVIENIWIYSTGEGRGLFRSTYAMIIVNALASVMLLAFCRVVLDRRSAFDR